MLNSPGVHQVSLKALGVPVESFAIRTYLDPCVIAGMDNPAARVVYICLNL